MAKLRLPCDVKEEVVSELAAHLEDADEEGLTQNLRESEARSLSNINWRSLAREIQDSKLKEDAMNNRTKGLWLPALANLTIAATLLVALEMLGLKARILLVSHLAMGLPFPWLFALPVSGAAAALLAKRAQAPLAARLIAGLAPSLVSLAVFCIMPLVFVLDRWQFSGFPIPLDYFFLSALVWIVLPVFPLLVGTLPFLRQSGLRKT
ncbi:MAG TPA: hypothetical protein VJ999_13035 [Candidatus Sulfotelmatobacter sp.]|nr:hypothetical protein [Candidatus Sulfotelmatobacter sp.]